MLYDALIDRLQRQFDTDRSTVESVVNARHKQLASEARWRQAVQQLATTDAGVGTYSLPSGLVHLSDVKVGGVVYEWAPEADVWRIDPSDRGRWFSLTDDASGTPTLQLNPAPDADGQAITGQAVLLPVDLSYGAGAVFVVPEDFHPVIHAGAKADLYEEVDERPDLAALQEQKFNDGVAKLRARRHSLVGPRVTRARIAGRDF